MCKYSFILIIVLFFACSAEKPAEKGSSVPLETAGGQFSEARQPSAAAAVYSLEITPAEAFRNSTLMLRSKGFNLSDTGAQWLVNGQSVQNPEPRKFISAHIKRGDNVQAKTLVNGKEILSNIVQIKNAPPELSKVKIMPEVFKLGDTFSVDAAGTDVDGDDVSISYEWTKNDGPAGNEKRISETIKRGDRISVKITPFDGEVYGSPVILKREIRNLPPMIAEDKKFTMKGDLYSYQVKAVDPDGDKLSYALKSAPQGMTIDQASGLIRWDIPADFQGKVSYTVSVNDGNGGEAKQDFVFVTRVEPGK